MLNTSADMTGKDIHGLDKGRDGTPWLTEHGIISKYRDDLI